MNRNIEFKALKDDMSNCNFVFGQLVYDAVGQPRITEVDSSGQGLTFHTCLKNTECQFTGLLDKNEKRIFEGDIVLFPNNSKYHIVEYYQSGFVLKSVDGKIVVYNIKSNFIEVVGNVFQNPELLGVSTPDA